jgi:hypothetical protein
MRLSELAWNSGWQVYSGRGSLAPHVFRKEHSLLDYLVRPRQHVRRNRHTNLLRGFQIDNELELRRLLDRGIFELRTFWNSVHIVNRPHLPVARLRTKGPVECIPVQELVGLE